MINLPFRYEKKIDKSTEEGEVYYVVKDSQGNFMFTVARIKGEDQGIKSLMSLVNSKNKT